MSTLLSLSLWVRVRPGVCRCSRRGGRGRVSECGCGCVGLRKQEVNTITQQPGRMTDRISFKNRNKVTEVTRLCERRLVLTKEAVTRTRLFLHTCLLEDFLKPFQL